MKSETTNNTTNITATPSVWHKKKTYIVCPECGEVAEVDIDTVLATYPAKYNWYCPHCGKHGYIFCHELSSKAVDPEVWNRAKHRWSTKCHICGQELFYDTEKPTICDDCRDAVIAMRKALGTWNE